MKQNITFIPNQWFIIPKNKNSKLNINKVIVLFFNLAFLFNYIKVDK